MRHVTLALFVLTSPLVACGGHTASDPARPLPPAPAEPAQPAGTPESPVLFAAARGAGLYVVSARPDTGEVKAFGPALPQPADTYEITMLQVSADGARAAVTLTPKVIPSQDWTSRESFVVLGDGATWTTIDHGRDLTMDRASDDLSLVVTMHSCPSSASSTVSVVRADGSHFYDDGTCAAGSPAAFVAAIAPNAAYIVVRTNDGALTAHLADGTSVPLTAPADEAVVGQVFATSLILADPAGPRWVDTAGRQLDVPGWASAAPTPCGLRALNGGLFALDDRAMRRVADLPPGVDPSTVVGVRGALVLTRADLSSVRTDAVDPTGAIVASYTPAAAHVAPRDAAGTPHVVVDPYASSATAKDAWTVFEDEYETIQPQVNGADVYERADDLWLFVDRAGTVGSNTVTLRRGAIPTGGKATWAERAYVASSTGARLLFTDSGALHVVDVDGGADRVLATDFTMADVSRVFRYPQP